MSTTFPTTIDVFVNPNAGNLLSDAAVLHSTQHANLNDAVAAIQADVGVTGSAVAGTVKNRLGALESGKQATLVSATNIKTVNGTSLLGAGDLPVGSTRTYRGVVASQAAMLALATVNVGDWVERSDLSNQIFELTTAGPATLGNWTAYPGGTAATTWAALTDKASANLPVDNTALASALAAKATPGLVSVNPTDITASRAITAADFAGGILRINSAGVVAITLPTVAAMGLAATAGQVRVIAFEVLGGGIPTFAGATASTTINGTAGPTTVLPLGGAPVTNGFYVLTQQAVGADTWSLS